MPKEYTNYFRHDQDVSGDLKIIALENRYGYSGSGLYWRIIEQLRASENYSLDYDEITFEGLAKKDFEPEKVKEAIDFCIEKKLFKQKGDSFYSDRLLRDMGHMEDNRQKRSMAGKASGKARQKTDTKDMDDPILAMLVSDYEESSGRMISGVNEQEMLLDLYNNYGDEAVRQTFKEHQGKPISYIVKVMDGDGKSKRDTKETSTAERKRGAEGKLR